MANVDRDAPPRDNVGGEFQQQVTDLRAAGCLCALLWMNGKTVAAGVVGTCPVHKGVKCLG